MPRSRPDDRFVTTPVLAQRLGVTIRRVNQMLASHILPPTRAENDLHDVDLCEERYELYREGGKGDWIGFLERLEGVQADRLFAKATRPNSTMADCRAASLAVQHSSAALKFFVTCRIPEHLRPMLIDHHRRKEDEALGAILFRTFELLAKANGTTPDAIRAEVCQDLDENPPNERRGAAGGRRRR